jgi:hypothetical protein
VVERLHPLLRDGTLLFFCVLCNTVTKYATHTHASLPSFDASTQQRQQVIFSCLHFSAFPYGEFRAGIPDRTVLGSMGQVRAVCFVGFVFRFVLMLSCSAFFRFAARDRAHLVPLFSIDLSALPFKVLNVRDVLSDTIHSFKPAYKQYVGVGGADQPAGAGEDEEDGDGGMVGVTMEEGDSDSSASANGGGGGMAGDGDKNAKVDVEMSSHPMNGNRSKKVKKGSSKKRNNAKNRQAKVMTTCVDVPRADR